MKSAKDEAQPQLVTQPSGAPALPPVMPKKRPASDGVIGTAGTQGNSGSRPTLPVYKGRIA